LRHPIPKVPQINSTWTLLGKTACGPLIFLLSQMTEYLSAKDSIRWHS
jgi:hypothetical protein